MKQYRIATTVWIAIALLSLFGTSRVHARGNNQPRRIIATLYEEMNVDVGTPPSDRMRAYGKERHTYDMKGNLLRTTRLMGNRPSYEDIYTYDRRGRRRSWIGINEDGSIGMKVIYHYGIGKRCTGYDYYYPEGDSLNVEHVIYTLDARGRWRTQQVVYNGETWESERYTYGRRQMTTTAANGIETITTYNRRGQPLTCSSTGGQPEENYREEYTYDKKGKLLTYNCFNADEKTVVQTVYNYNSDGQKISEVQYFPLTRIRITTKYEIEKPLSPGS